MKVGNTKSPYKSQLVAAVLLAATILCYFILQKPLSFRNNLERARWIMRHHPVIDTHNDLPWNLKTKNITNPDISELPEGFATDIRRIRRGLLTGVFWSAYIDCTFDLTEKTTAVKDTLIQIDLIKRIVSMNPDLEFATSAKDIKRIFKNRKVASLIGVEGGHQIDDSIEVLRMYFELGVRYMTLTHFCPTNWADSNEKEIHNGLTDFGKRIVGEMNRLGMLVDISHVSPKVMRDVIATSKAPLFGSHSAIQGENVRKNMPEDVILAMKEKDGVVMVNFFSNIHKDGSQSDIDEIVDRIMYVVSLVGTEHVGLGSDFDGLSSYPIGLEDVSTYPALVARLYDRGLSDTDIVNIVGGNFLWVLEKTEQVAKDLGTNQ
ncbi:hypothetical protein HDV06_006449 [Boothiomyces sp. JEL0866]|nr:hypothetical protein HDV06_001230 [Boothiomyces sp. JEL0866]KAJ3324556.1 hypothetical protein HDV06_006449 [Boothiomyces sp. JEL0866]